MEKEVQFSFSLCEWRRPLVAIALSFLCNVECAMITIGEWPYMSTIDHESTSTFFGYATAVNKAGHAVAALVFSLWAHRTSSIKAPVLTARILTLIACVMYLLVEFLPSHRRWWMLVCYLLFGVGFGTSALLRAYIARVTSADNRSTAYALQNGATVLAVVVGPFAQLSFAALPYPGIAVFSQNIKLNIFTAPIWYAVFTNIIALAVTAFLLEDDSARKEAPLMKDAVEPVSLQKRFERILSVNVPYLLISLVLIEKMISGLFGSTMAAIGGPLLTAVFALSGQQIVLLFAISQITVGIIALLLSLLFLCCKLGHRVSSRTLHAFSCCTVIAGYVITFPYPFAASSLQSFNETTRTGCNPLEYSWCDSQQAVNVASFTVILVVVSGLALPSAAISLDTIYSKIVGDADQNLMQSLFTIVDDAIAIVGPIFGSTIFTSVGLSYVYVINGSIYVLGGVIWLAAWSRLKPYK